MVLIVLNYELGDVDIIRSIPDDIDDYSDFVYNVLGYKESEVSWMLVEDGLVIANWKYDRFSKDKIVRSRSGLAAKKRVFVLNSPGTIDSDYRNGIGVILINLGDEDFAVLHGDRIAQLVLNQVPQINWVPVNTLDELSSTDRGGHCQC